MSESGSSATVSMALGVVAARAAIERELSALAALPDRLGPAFEQAVGLLMGCSGRVVVTGLGKSGHVGAKIAATLASTGTPAFFVHATEALHGDSGMLRPGDVLLALSNSGATAEVCAFARMALRVPVPVIAMSGQAPSPLTELATLSLDVSVTREADPLDLAPTASTTVTLAMGDALAAALMAVRGFTAAEFHRYHPGGSLGALLAGDQGGH